MITPAWTDVAHTDEPPPLSAHAVDLWLIDLDDAPSSITGTLNEEERDRARRFLFARDSRRFAAARSYLRHILGACLARSPTEIAFEFGPWGKPALKGSNASRLAFNLAHSGGHMLIALAQMESLGVDLEVMRPIDDWREVATSAFTPGEARAVLTSPEATRMDAFYACWTRKEAVIKLWGEGLSADLQSFEVSTNPDMPARILSMARPGTPADSVTLWGFKVLPQSWAALAAPASDGSVELRFWRLV